MQVDLAEVRAIDVGGHLPDSGLLQVFFEWHRSTPLLEEDCRVTVDTGARNDVSHADFPPDLETECQFAQFPLVPTLEWTIPGPDETGLENIPDDAIAFWDVAEEMLEVRQGFGPYWTPKHRMLGWADFIQSPGMVDDARLLLQVDSDPPSGCDWPARTGMMWGDCGRIYWITDEPGLKGDFTRISPFWECC